MFHIGKCYQLQTWCTNWCPCAPLYSQCTVCGLQSGKIAPNIVRADEREQKQLCSTQAIWTPAVLDCSCDLYISFIAMVWDTRLVRLPLRTRKPQNATNTTAKSASESLRAQWPGSLLSTDLPSEVHLKEMQRVQVEAVKVVNQVTGFSTQMMDFLFTLW